MTQEDSGDRFIPADRLANIDLWRENGSYDPALVLGDGESFSINMVSPLAADMYVTTVGEEGPRYGRISSNPESTASMIDSLLDDQENDFYEVRFEEDGSTLESGEDNLEASIGVGALVALWRDVDVKVKQSMMKDLDELENLVKTSKKSPADGKFRELPDEDEFYRFDDVELSQVQQDLDLVHAHRHSFGGVMGAAIPGHESVKGKMPEQEKYIWYSNGEPVAIPINPSGSELTNERFKSLTRESEEFSMDEVNRWSVDDLPSYLVNQTDRQVEIYLEPESKSTVRPSTFYGEEGFEGQANVSYAQSAKVKLDEEVYSVPRSVMVPLLMSGKFDVEISYMDNDESGVWRSYA